MVDVSIHARGARTVFGSARVVTREMQSFHTPTVAAYGELTLRVADDTLHLYVDQAAAADTLRALEELRACVEALMRDHAEPAERVV